MKPLSRKVRSSVYTQRLFGTDITNSYLPGSNASNRRMIQQDQLAGPLFTCHNAIWGEGDVLVNAPDGLAPVTGQSHRTVDV